MKIRTFRIGDARKRGEGLRIGTTRRPPRGVAKRRWPEYFDVWFPTLAPSAKLLRSTRSTKRFFDAYRRELTRPPASHAIQLLAALARTTPIALGCYCEDESRCHRRVLRDAVVAAYI
jgi:uncharacterized protein YeaO (DUF488 family)